MVRPSSRARSGTTPYDAGRVQRILGYKRHSFDLALDLEHIQIPITLGIGQINLVVDAVFVAFFKDLAIIGFDHDHRNLIFISDCHRGLGDVAAEGPEEQLHFVDSGQTFIEFGRFCLSCSIVEIMNFTGSFLL